MSRKRARPVRVEQQTVKRYCDTGAYAPSSARANNCGAPRKRADLSDPFTPRDGDRDDKVCYATKGEAMRAFVSRNQSVIEDAGGLSARLDGGELDSINEKYGLRGRKRVATMKEAISVALDGSKCLDKLDLDALNETQVCEGRCVLPDAATIALTEDRHDAQLRDREPGSDDEFDLFGSRRAPRRR